MNEVRFVVGDADAGLRERLDEEISAFNAATGHHDGRCRSWTLFACQSPVRDGAPSLAPDYPSSTQIARAARFGRRNCAGRPRVQTGRPEGALRRAAPAACS
jgi:hypothetical protein